MGPDEEKKDKPQQKGRSKSGRAPAKGRIVGLRLWLFRIAAVTVIPAVLLILAELCLRISGFGYPTSAIIRREYEGRQICVNNLKFGWRFFPRQIAREIRAFVFPAEKSPQTYRIFVLGGSAAMGIPEPAYSFSRILTVLLNDQYPDVNFEVINLGMPAINSHGVRHAAKDCARYEPDLFVVYLGNNEVTGPYGAGTVFSPLSPSLSFIRASIAVKSTRLGQLLERFLTLPAALRGTPPVWTGLQMFLDKQVRFNSPGLQHVYKHFESNLADICNFGREAGAEVILCNVAANIKDCPPFASLHNPGLIQAQKTRWDNIYGKAVQFESEGKYPEALENYSKAVETDEQFAELHFRMGRCYWRMGRYEKAEGSYIRALFLDTLRFRAEEKTNEAIRRAAQRAGKDVNFLDIVKVFRDASPYGVPGNEFFYEHVHFNFEGNYLLARAIFGRIEKIILKQRELKRISGSSLLSGEDCMERLAFTGWDRMKTLEKVLGTFIQKPPFINQAYHAEQVAEISRQIDALKYYTQPLGLQESVDMYKKALKRYPLDWQLHWAYGTFLNNGLNEYEAAIEHLNMVIRELPHCYVYHELSALLYRQNRIDEGIEVSRLAMEMQPLEALSYFNLALGYDRKGQFKRAIELYSKALNIDPQISDKGYKLLAIAFHKNGQDYKAIETFRKGTRVFPGSADLHFGLGVFLMDIDKNNEAAREFNIALSIQPDFPLAKRALRELQAKSRN